eukprot:6282445-Prymnesium_polylepis.2
MSAGVCMERCGLWAGTSVRRLRCTVCCIVARAMLRPPFVVYYYCWQSHNAYASVVRRSPTEPGPWTAQLGTSATPQAGSRRGWAKSDN